MISTATDEVLLQKQQQTRDIMRAAFIAAPRRIGVEEYQLPAPGPQEVRLRLEGCGVCASSLPAWQGREWFSYHMPAGEPGHEGWGIVDAVGADVKDLEPGDRVTAISYRAFATHDIAHESAVVKLPEFLHDKPFPGEPLGCAMNIFSRSKIRKGQTVAIIGIGFLGALLIQLAKSAGARVIAISRRDYSLEVARANSADECIKLHDHNQIIEEVKKLTGGEFCDRVIEVTGKEWPLNLAIELTKVRGRLMVAGFHQDGMRSVNVQLLNWRGIDLINTHEREVSQYVKGVKKAITAIHAGEMYPFPLLTHTYSLDRLDEAFEALENRPDGFVKAMISYE